MIMRKFAAALLVGLLAVLIGCSASEELTGSAVPNSRPDTRVTGQPPTLLEAGYSVQFHWTGGDPDGRIVGYQWKISNNGLDGISPRDTLTFDPVTGAEINPWHYTTGNDSLFYVLADLPGFEGDPEGFERSFRTHSFLVRAVDDKGAVDPSPAIITFTSTTIVPTCQATYPSSAPGAIFVPAKVNLGYEGQDADFELGVPTHVRFLWTDAQYEDASGNLIDISTRYQYETYGQELIDFDDPDWSPWQRYATAESDRKISFDEGLDGSLYFFAVQVRDTAGAVSIGKSYAREVLNLRIAAGQFKPAVRVVETYLGTTDQIRSDNIPAGQPLNFSWSASAERYNGEVVSMRHGWDLADVDDINDPGWSVPAGLTDQNRFAEETSFMNGEHTFWLRVVDDSGGVEVLRWSISIIPFVSRENQLNMVLLDQVQDDSTGRWPQYEGGPAMDQEEYRNAYWRFLDGVGGISEFSWERDRVDQDEANQFAYEDLVRYKVALIPARAHLNQAIFADFIPQNGVDRFVWLTPYQERAGNLFLVGEQSMESFLEQNLYMVPIIFDCPVAGYVQDGVTYTIGFGTKELADGTEIDRGPLLYPYATAGISSLDWSVPRTKWIYGRRARANEERRLSCVGIKQLKLAEDFRAHHNIGPAAIADVINTSPLMDWRDPLAGAGLDSALATSFPFPGDEFVNGIISEAPSTLTPQSCEDGYNGQCIETMFTGVARFDWMRETLWDYGDDDWPYNRYSLGDLKEICGEMALSTYVGDDGTLYPLATARTTGQTYGYLSYKTLADKPVPLADVYWGFDPYRFDHEQTKKAIMWVLSDYLQLPVEAGTPR